MMTTTEARAHLSIIETIDRAIRDNWHWAVTRDAVWKPLETFAPRCSACRRVLKFGPLVNGSRIVACTCGVCYFEANIWYGVPKVEKRA
jgi:hypothetical protein